MATLRKAYRDIPQLHIQILRQCLQTHRLLNVTQPMQMKTRVKLVHSQPIKSNSGKYCGRGRTPRKSTKRVTIIMKYVGSNARGSHLNQRYVTDLDIRDHLRRHGDGFAPPAQRIG